MDGKAAEWLSYPNSVILFEWHRFVLALSPRVATQVDRCPLPPQSPHNRHQDYENHWRRQKAYGERFLGSSPPCIPHARFQWRLSSELFVYSTKTIFNHLTTLLGLSQMLT